MRTGDIRVEQGKIVEIGEALDGAENIDCTGKYILPGFIDTHFHGACGVQNDLYELLRLRRTRNESIACDSRNGKTRIFSFGHFMGRRFVLSIQSTATLGEFD